MIEIERFLSRLKNVRKTAAGWTALCPGHGDTHNSLSVGLSDDGKILVCCHAGCDVANVVAVMGLTMRDLFSSGGGGPYPYVIQETTKPLGEKVTDIGSPRISRPEKPSETLKPYGCALQDYSEEKKLPLPFLGELGLSEIYYQGKKAVRIPFFGESKQEVAVLFRLGLSGDRYRWKSGCKPAPYGLWRLKDARRANYIILVEGASDVQTLWFHKFPALGLPSATWKEDWFDYLEEIPVIFVVIEPDQGGEVLKGKLAASRIRDRLQFLNLGQAGDISELYLADPPAFPGVLSKAIEEAIPLSEVLTEKENSQRNELWQQCKELATQDQLLDLFVKDLHRMGVTGEEKATKQIYLALTSRLLQRPVSTAIKGPSSGGKSHVLTTTLKFFPDEAYYALSAMSERALAYSDEPMKNRVLILYEAAGMGSEFTNYLIRSLLSEGLVKYETVEKTNQGLKPRLIEKEGPTGFLTTTTQIKLHKETETRLISIQVTDTQEQTKNILAIQAEQINSDRDLVDLRPWRTLQQWLTLAELRVVVPYAMELAQKIPPVAVRLRRDFPAILSLISAHAILHQATRERDQQGRIIATVEDYAVIKDLVGDSISEGVEVTVSQEIRDTVGAVERVGDPNGITVASVQRVLDLDKSSTWRRVQAAIERGFLKNLENRKYHPARLVIAELLPEDQRVLPDPEELGNSKVSQSFKETGTSKPSEKQEDSPPGFGVSQTLPKIPTPPPPDDNWEPV